VEAARSDASNRPPQELLSYLSDILMSNMRTALLAAGALLSVLGVSGCHRSGTWVDDPNNFQRAWGQSAPRDLQILHSWYWRSAHFTREEALYFQFARHEELMRGFIAENRLQPVADPTSVNVSDYSCFLRPPWFAPKPLAAYNVWVTPRDASRALVLEDRSTRDFFVSACQL
jgi:hypothetical protein